MNQKRRALYDEILHIRNISNPGTVISNNKTAAGEYFDSVVKTKKGDKHEKS